jgi:hypothetical protein
MAETAVDAVATAPSAASPRIAKVTFRIEASISLERQRSGVDLNIC